MKTRNAVLLSVIAHAVLIPIVALFSANDIVIHGRDYFDVEFVFVEPSPVYISPPKYQIRAYMERRLAENPSLDPIGLAATFAIEYASDQTRPK